MNLINLKRMFNHILLNVPKKNLVMKYFRDGDEISHECDSVGCIIGHCTILDDLENLSFKDDGKIDFFKWSEEFTGLTPYWGKWEWNWCFSSYWNDDKEQILLRLKYIIDNQSVPEDWDRNSDYILPLQKLEPYEFD